MISDRLRNRSDLPLADKNWLVAGLGNPGERYENTRHNLGFMLVDRLAGEFHTQIKRLECRSLIGQTGFVNETIEFVKPQTFMNLSGEAISCLLQKESRDYRKMIIIVDDLALPLGTIRIRQKGSDGGHNGLKSIIACLRTEDFIRLRIGIRPDHPLSNTRNFVLEKFSKTDLETVEDVLTRGAEALKCLISDGIARAMSQYNN